MCCNPTSSLSIGPNHQLLLYHGTQHIRQERAGQQAAFKASAKLGVSRPTSRCVMSDRCGSYTDSTGSSMVSTCLATVLLMCSVMAASGVLLPDPVAPTTSTSPCPSSASERNNGGA